jgi:type IV pilus assembly protein PilB
MDEKAKLGQLLVAAGAIDEAQLAAALGEQKKWGRPLGMTLVRMGLLDEPDLIRTLAEQLGLPMARLRGKRVDPEVLDIVPVDLAEKHRCLPLFVRPEGAGKALFIGMEDPADLDALDDLGFRVGMKIRPVLVAPTELEEALHRHYHWASATGDAPPLELAEAARSGDDVDELGSLDFEGQPSDAALPLEVESESGAGQDPSGGSSPVQADAIVRALAQLLVEKGVITRAELVERLCALETEAREGAG